jgi:hypothetical protein
MDFHIGTLVHARPATVPRPIRGTVVETSGTYTVVVDASGLHIAIDVEDCEIPAHP